MTSFFLGNWATRTYFVTVVTAATVMMTASAIGSPSWPTIIMVALTSPVSIIFAPVFLLGDGWMTVPMMLISMIAGYLLNTLLINMIATATTARRRPPQGVQLASAPRAGRQPVAW